jgi:hypothetical protein
VPGPDRKRNVVPHFLEAVSVAAADLLGRA